MRKHRLKKRLRAALDEIAALRRRVTELEARPAVFNLPPVTVATPPMLPTDAVFPVTPQPVRVVPAWAPGLPYIGDPLPIPGGTWCGGSSTGVAS